VSDSQCSLIVNCPLSKLLINNICCEVGTSILHTSDLNEPQYSQVQCTIAYEYKRILDLDAGRMARSQNPEGPATGHPDTGFLGFPGS
jgi:hypothetical protein